jgi:predicted PurR-regulated permease PerM
MSITPPGIEEAEPVSLEQVGPIELRDPIVRHELKKATVWAGVVLAILGVIVLAEPLLLIFAGIVLAAMLDGGTRLLGRVLPIGRGWRLAIVTIAAIGFLVWTFYYAGTELVTQAERLREAVTLQANRILAWANSMHLFEGGVDLQQVGSQIMGSLGRIGSAVSSALGAVTSAVMILVIGIFIAAEPRLYQRGVAWMLPSDSRDRFFRTAERMGFVMRRLMAGRLIGMAVEGIGTWVLLWIGGVPMAALLGILTGLLAFLPNIGAIISGVLIILAGFSVSTDAGLWAIGVYFVVQTVDGYLIVPYVAKKTVDMAPALVLGAQLLAGALFGLLGLMLADPMVAMIKTALEQKSDDDQAEAEAEAQAKAEAEAAAAVAAVAAASLPPTKKRRFGFLGKRPKPQA